MNRHERRRQKAERRHTPALIDPELHGVLGQMLDHVAPRINELAVEWIREAKDITDLVILIGVKFDGRGTVVSRSRADFATEVAAETAPAATKLVDAAREVLGGPRNMIPAVFMIMDVPDVHVTWLDPVAASELH